MGPSAPLFNVQSLSTQDGPGLRTAVFLQGCPLRCTWCSNPEGQSSRPLLQWSETRCRRCRACVGACVPGAVRVAPETPQAPPQFDRSVCPSCTAWACTAACPHGALQRVGRMWDADELLAVIKSDLRLYRNSGGGVTFTGGEPLAHCDFVGAVARNLHEALVHVAIETCGQWDWASAAKCLECCDLVFFDVKTLDDDVHRRFTGSSNAQILGNLRRLAETCGQRVIVTVPVVPGVLDSPDSIAQIGAHIHGLGLRRVRLLPYHNLGRGKYAALGRPYAHEPWDREIPPQTLVAAAARLAALGLDVSVEGMGGKIEPVGGGR